MTKLESKIQAKVSELKNFAIADHERLNKTKEVLSLLKLQNQVLKLQNQILQKHGNNNS